MKVQRFLILATGLVMLAIVVVSATSKVTMAEESIEISLWGGWPEIEPIYQEVAAAYKEEHPNVTIKVLTSPLREFEQKLSATIPADTAACIIEASPYPMQKFLAAGLIPPAPANVVEFMTASGRFPEALVKDNLGEDGNYYGINYFQGRHVIYWNKDKFEAAGLAGPPAKMEELVAYAQKLAEYDGDTLTSSGVSLRLSGGGSGVGEKFWMYLFPNGGSIIEKTPSGKWHNGYNNEAGRKTVQMYLDLVWKYKADSHEIKHDAEAFELEQTAMFVRESWVIGDAAKKAPNLNFDTAPMPKGERWGDLATGVNLYVTRNCKHSDVAWDFILFLNSEENLQALLKKTGWLPQRLDIDLSPVVNETPQYKSFLFSDPDYQIYTYPTLPEFDEILTKFAERLVNAFLDQSLVDNPDGVAKLLEEAAVETDAILERNGHYGTE
jgi:multiple sugar transport system substrate-binding protein